MAIFLEMVRRDERDELEFVSVVEEEVVSGLSLAGEHTALNGFRL